MVERMPMDEAYQVLRDHGYDDQEAATILWLLGYSKPFGPHSRLRMRKPSVHRSPPDAD